MTQPLPEPLVSPEVDLRGLEWMPYYGDRLARSELNACCSDAAYRASHNLWWAAWNSVPAASLPDDDVALTRFADLGRDIKAFRKIKEDALHGFVRCSDGRLYHKFLSGLAVRAWTERLSYQRNRSRDRDRLRRWREDHRNDEETTLETGFHDTGNAQETPLKRIGQDRTGQDRTEEEEERLESLPTSPENPSPSNGAQAPPKNGSKRSDYAFVGRIIRLTDKNFREWQQLYWGIPDLRAELATLDVYYDQTLVAKDRNNWFLRCSSALDNKHQKAVAGMKTQQPPNGRDLLSEAADLFPKIPEARIRELSKAPGCLEYGASGEYQCWKFLHGRTD